MRSGRSDLAFGHAFAAVSGLGHFVARSREEIAQDAAQVFLIFDDKDALGHVVVALRNSARIGSCIWKVAP